MNKFLLWEIQKLRERLLHSGLKKRLTETCKGISDVFSLEFLTPASTIDMKETSKLLASFQRGSIELHVHHSSVSKGNPQRTDPSPANFGGQIHHNLAASERIQTAFWAGRCCNSPSWFTTEWPDKKWT